MVAVVATQCALGRLRAIDAATPMGLRSRCSTAAECSNLCVRPQQEPPEGRAAELARPLSSTDRVVNLECKVNHPIDSQKNLSIYQASPLDRACST